VSDSQMQDFGDRLRRISRRNRTLSRGFVLSVSNDGLIIARPESSRMRFPWRVLLFLLVAVIGFKTVLHAVIGPEEYSQRLARLSNGTVAEQMSAYVLHADPVTVWLANLVSGRS
jgi:hypothetical protein